IIQRENRHSLERNLPEIGKTRKVLIEGFSKRSDDFLLGRTSNNKVVLFPKENKMKGQYVNVLIERCTKGTLFGKLV
ncbi:MAG: TRAM domain-containing protein, partial [Cyclobacteriaceae bacterium]|nr:TRAM domain-containing protein [Cyclobacteriaceae bacterium]